MIRSITFILMILFSLNLNAQSFAPDSIKTVKNELKDGSMVSVKGDIDSSEETFIISDNSGTISLDLSSLTDPDIFKGDHITISGTLQVSEKGEKYILAKYFRKHSYVKNPSNCCMPDF